MLIVYCAHMLAGFYEVMTLNFVISGHYCAAVKLVGC